MNIPVIGEGVAKNKVEVERKDPIDRGEQGIIDTTMPCLNADYASGTGVVKTQISVNRTVAGCERATKDDEITDEKMTETIMKTMESIVTRLTPNDYNELEQEQSKLEQYQLEQLDQALSRIQRNRIARKVSLQKEIRKNKRKQEHIEEISTHLMASNSYEEKIAERLEDYGIPVTKEKIQRITGALNLFDGVKNLSDSSKAQLIQSGAEFTLDHVYKSSYSAEPTARKKMDEQQWNQMKKQVRQILSQNGYEATQETMTRAKWLIDNQIPLNEETLKKAEQLEQQSQTATKEHTLDQIICSLLEGIEPEQVNLNHPTIEEAVALIKKISEIQETNVEFVAKKEEPITLGALITERNEANLNLNPIETVKAVRAKRQLEEIRLRLTVEHSYQLLKHGIKIDTLPMESVIEQLKEMEQAYYNQFLSEQTGEITEEIKQQFYDSMGVIDELKFVPKSIVGLQVYQIDENTVLQLHAIGKNVKAAYEKRELSYEALMTTPRSDLGDSIKKAFTGISRMLLDLGLNDSEENKEAVRILAYNRMDITKESIETVKAAHHKVVTIIQQLKPATVLSFIRQGINPIDIPFKELESILSEKENLQQGEESFSRYLYELDRKSGITPEERNAFIGIYRMLYQIQSIDGAASGAVLQRNEEFSLENLFAAVRNYKSGGVNQIIDDQTALQMIDQHVKKTIQQQIRLAYESQEKQEDFSYEQQKIQQLRQFMNQKDKTPAKLIATYGLEQTIETVVTAAQITTDKKRRFHKIRDELGEKYIKKLENTVHNLQKVPDYYNEMGIELKQRMEEAYHSEDITYQRLQSLKTNYNCIQLLSSLSLKHYYEVPIRTGDTVSCMNIIIEPSEINRGRVRINTELPTLGMVKADIKVQKDYVKAFIVSNSKQGVALLRAGEKQLQDRLSELTVREVVIDYGLSENYDNDGSYKEQGETIELLYDIAKTVVTHIQTIEEHERGLKKDEN